jgi:hypothetical protein
MSDGFGKLSNAATDFSWGSSGANEKTNLFNKKANPFGAAGGGPASADTSNLDWGESSSFAPAASGNGFGAASFGSPAQNGTGKGKGAKPPVVVYNEDGEEDEDDEGDIYDEGPNRPRAQSPGAIDKYASHSQVTSRAMGSTRETREMCLRSSTATRRRR